MEEPSLPNPRTWAYDPSNILGCPERYPWMDDLMVARELTQLRLDDQSCPWLPLNQEGAGSRLHNTLV